MPHVIVACCILHNFVEKAKQAYYPAWDQERAEAELEHPKPPILPVYEERDRGEIIRGNLSACMARNFPVMAMEGVINENQVF